MSSNKMKIAVVGCGALGSYYGALLCRRGHEVHFLLRSDYDAVRENGVVVESLEETFRVRPHCARSAHEVGPVDLVMIGLKSTANHILPITLPPLVGSNTAILTMQNGLGNEDAAAKIVGGEKILGGVCFVCLNRIAPGRIVHLAHGAVIVGEFGRPGSDRTQRMAVLIADSGVKCRVAANLLQARWEKLVWNIPFNGLGVAGGAGYYAVVSGQIPPGTTLQKCLPTDALLSDSRWEKLVRELMLETIAAARAQGFDVPESAADRQIERTRSMGAYSASTLVDFEHGREL